MKTGKYLIVLSVFVLLGTGASFNAFASGHENHIALAEQHERLAQEMQARIDEKVDYLKHRPSTSFLGRNGKSHKSRIFDKIHEYEQVISENLEKAAYHRTIANEQASNKSYAQPNQTGGQVNKARIKSDRASGL